MMGVSTLTSATSSNDFLHQHLLITFATWTKVKASLVLKHQYLQLSTFLEDGNEGGFPPWMLRYKSLDRVVMCNRSSLWAEFSKSHTIIELELQLTLYFKNWSKIMAWSSSTLVATPWSWWHLWSKPPGFSQQWTWSKVAISANVRRRCLRSWTVAGCPAIKLETMLLQTRNFVNITTKNLWRMQLSQTRLALHISIAPRS